MVPPWPRWELSLVLCVVRQRRVPSFSFSFMQRSLCCSMASTSLQHQLTVLALWRPFCTLPQSAVVASVCWLWPRRGGQTPCRVPATRLQRNLGMCRQAHAIYIWWRESTGQRFCKQLQSCIQESGCCVYGLTVLSVASSHSFQCHLQSFINPLSVSFPS